MKHKLIILTLLLNGIFLSNPAQSQDNNAQWLDQGWTSEERQYWHYLSLGQALAPVSWLQSLEVGKTQTLFLDREYLGRLGVLYDDKNSKNPLGLPIGFAVAPQSSPVSGYFGLTCAACHTGQISYKGKQIKYDGGSVNFDIYTILGDFFESLAITINDKSKWDRFVKRVQSIEKISENDLREKVNNALKEIIWATNATEKSPGTYVIAGPGRADAFNRIGNYIFGQRLLVSSNYYQSNAPSNYPPLWNIWKFNWVHYNASFTQPMARNILQVLGNNGTTNFIDGHGVPVKGNDRWKTSVDFVGASEMEAGIRKLSPPRWPENILGSVDQAKAKRGKILFEKNCAGCHSPRPIRPPDNLKAELAVALVPLNIIGTDPAHAKTFAERRFDISKLTGNTKPMSAPDGLTFAINKIENYAYEKLNLDKEKRNQMNGFGRENLIRAPLAYKARTLEAIWASPPYLHNGSVPNIFELLSPVSERSKQFWTGTYEYDPVKLGYLTDHSNGNYFLFDTSISGNQNIGHEFSDGKGPGIIGRKFSVNERYDLIEYLKVIDQDPPKSHSAVSYDWEWVNRK